MRLFLDTEFNGFRGDLISIALTDEVGRSFYGVTEIDPIEVDPWVLENVMPVIGTTPAVSIETLRENMMKFLRLYNIPEIIVDWPSDPLYLFQLMLGDSHDETIFYPFNISVKNFRHAMFKSKVPHNALEDARALRNSYLGRTIPEIMLNMTPIVVDKENEAT